MNAAASNWIPRSRIRVAIAIALAFLLAAVIGALWSLFSFVLLLPAAGAGWAAFLMLRIRHQLSPAGGGWQSRIHGLAAARLALPGDSTVSLLDIGCGDGSLLIALLGRSSSLIATGVDYWGANWDYAKSACEAHLAQHDLRATFRRMDAAHLEFPDSSFDAVVSVMCFHEVRAPHRVRMRGPLVAVSEALRVLKPGGTFVLIDRFADASDYGDASELAIVLRAAGNLRREPLVPALGVPWPLRIRRALGPVEILSGQRLAAT